jgi:hypothetical protein
MEVRWCGSIASLEIVKGDGRNRGAEMEGGNRRTAFTVRWWRGNMARG